MGEVRNPIRRIPIQMPVKNSFPPIDFKMRFPALDGIRALAVTMVFFYHYGGGSHGGRILQTLNAIRGYGWLGVDVFFVLSGFLITGIHFDTRNDSRFFQRFYIRRGLRIFPVFYLVFFVLLSLTPVLHYEWHGLQLTYWAYLGNFFANSNNSLSLLISKNYPNAATVLFGHFWSLCVEEQFYLLWPLAIWMIRDRVRLLWTAGGMSLLAVLLRVAMVALTPQDIAWTWVIRTLPFRLDTLLIGAILALLLRGPSADVWQRRCKYMLVAASTLLGILLFLPFSRHFFALLTGGLLLAAVASAGLIGSALRPGSMTFQFFHLRPIRTLGKYSYGFYIFQMLYYPGWVHFLRFLMGKTHSILLGGLIEIPCNFFITFMVSKLSYDFFEVRFLRWKDRFQYDSEKLEHRHAFSAK